MSLMEDSGPGRRGLHDTRWERMEWFEKERKEIQRKKNKTEENMGVYEV